MTAAADASPTGGRWRPFAVATLCGLAAVAGALVALSRVDDVVLTERVVGVLAGTFIVFVAIVGWTVTSATRQAGPQRLTVATWVTLGRGWALVLFAGIVALAPTETRLQWLAAGLFLVAAVGDAADGAVARRTETVSELGARLDTETDALVVLVGTLAVVGLRSVPGVFVLVGLARYGFVAAARLRRRRDQPIYDLEANRYRKFTGATIMGTIALGLVPVVDPAVSRAVGWLVTVPILTHFIWDYLGITGRRPG